MNCCYWTAFKKHIPAGFIQNILKIKEDPKLCLMEYYYHTFKVISSGNIGLVSPLPHTQCILVPKGNSSSFRFLRDFSFHLETVKSFFTCSRALHDNTQQLLKPLMETSWEPFSVSWWDLNQSPANHVQCFYLFSISSSGPRDWVFATPLCPLNGARTWWSIESLPVLQLQYSLIINK